jgi:hypothetical protein
MKPTKTGLLDEHSFCTASLSGGGSQLLNHAVRPRLVANPTADARMA